MRFYIKLAASPLGSRGFAPRGIITSSITYSAEKKANGSKIFAKFAQFVKKMGGIFGF